jgi:hypothetical protein
MRSCSIFAATGILLLATSAWAMGFGRATIPFPFHVGEAELSAGDYDIIIGQPYVGAVTFRSCTTGRVLFTPPFFFDRQQNPSSPEAKLVFNRYGEDQYFLSQIWDPLHPNSMKLAQSQSEIVTSKIVAGLLPDKVTIALRIR